MIALYTLLNDELKLSTELSNQPCMPFCQFYKLFVSDDNQI